MSDRKLFGTDGVRGPVGEKVTPELATALGRAATESAPADRPQVLILRDTRESGPMLESALAAGIAAAGGDALIGGILPSAAASILVRRHGLDLGIVVSASHNPWRDNGIKFFGANGIKLDDETETEIEERLERPSANSAVGRVRTLEGALEDYLREVESVFSLDLTGRSVLLDCANGAAFRAGPTAFERFGATVELVAAEPDGRNINEGCGSTHIDSLAERLAASDAELGFAFDGDADRVLAVDRAGNVRDGEEIVAIAALHLRDSARDFGGAAVTVMTNYGFHTAMGEAGVEVATTKVGDRHVIEELLKRDWTIGGEQSGHVIWTEFAPTGDGIAAALLVMEALGDRDLSKVTPFEKLPQRLENVRLPDRSALAGAEALWAAVESEGSALEGRGRVLVRPSGTEPLVRLMVEAPTEGECEQVLARLTEVADSEFGRPS
ncbi:MAG: phosphoglucosamine mutase [Solirubrobacterales bacterium]